MTLPELLFFLSAIVLAVVGGAHFSQFGVLPGVAGAIGGLFPPFVVGSLLCRIESYLLARRSGGRQRKAALKKFRSTNSETELTIRSTRSQKARDGSTIVTIFYGNSKPERRAFFRFSDSPTEPLQLNFDEVQSYIDVPAWL